MIGRPTLLVLSNHVYSAAGRKASVHFIADEFLRRGFEVRFVTVGASWVTRLKRFGRYETLRSTPSNKWLSQSDCLYSYLHYSGLGPVNMRSGILNWLTEPLFVRFGASLLEDVNQHLARATVVLIDSGSAVCFFDYVRSVNNAALVVYNAADLLGAVGVHPSLLRLEKKVFDNADVVRLASAQMAATIPSCGNLVFAPHGIDKELFARPVPNPYRGHGPHIVSIGSMLFDSDAVRAVANAASHTTVHVFGAPWKGKVPPNVILYGERSFKEIVPYLKFADAGLAPYKIGKGQEYLVQSSLKIKQYTFCRLPIIAPDTIGWQEKHICSYSPSDLGTYSLAVSRALSMDRGAIDVSSVPGWSDVVDSILNRAPQEKVSRLALIEMSNRS